MAQSQAQGEQSDSLHGTHSGSRNINNGDPLVPALEQTNSIMGLNPLHGNDLHLDHLHNGSNSGGGIDEPSKNDSRAPLYDRSTRLRAVAGANFRVAQPLGLGDGASSGTVGLAAGHGKIDGAGEVNSPLPSEQVSLLPSEQLKPLETLLPSEQSESDKRKAEWLKTLLPELTGGWWDVAANGKGFIIKQKWREQKRQITQTYPRVSREQFQALKGSNYAKQIISDRIRGHLDECGTHKLKTTRERARCAAARLGASH